MSRLMRLNIVALTALVGLAIDQGTKIMAVRHLSSTSITQLGPLNLSLVYNLGDTIHPHSASLMYEIGIRSISVAILVLAFFAFKSRVAAVGIGLVAAGFLGNFLNLVLPPHKVPDFIMLGPVWTANLADFFNLAGTVLIACAIMANFVGWFRSLEAKRMPSTEQLTGEQLTGEQLTGEQLTGEQLLEKYLTK